MRHFGCIFLLLSSSAAITDVAEGICARVPTRELHHANIGGIGRVTGCA